MYESLEQWRDGHIMAALCAEAKQLASVMLEVAPTDWSRPTPCPPWNIAELLAHVATAIAWIPAMLAAPAPARADIGAADYYRPDDRFSSQVNAVRIDLARQRAASASDGHALAAEFDRAWRHILHLCEREPADRVVRTRHGDAMLLTDFLTTRIVEVGIHGLDLAAALGRPPWLTPAAARILTNLLLSSGGADAALSELGWDQITFLRKATGRQPLTAGERRHVQQRGIRWLALG